MSILTASTDGLPLAAIWAAPFDPGFSYVLSLVLSSTFFLCGRIALSASGTEGG